MPGRVVNGPVSSVASDRLALSVGWVRPGPGGIGGTVNPATVTGQAWFGAYCFAGSDE